MPAEIIEPGDIVKVRLKSFDRKKLIPTFQLDQKLWAAASKKPGLRERASALGAEAYFEKPYEGKVLTATVRSILGVEA